MPASDRCSESKAGSLIWTARYYHGQCGLWEDLFRTKDGDCPDLIRSLNLPSADWREAARIGGFPVPALVLRDERSRSLWFENYVMTYLERDLRALSNISSLPDFRRIMRVASMRLGQILNESEIARQTGVPQATVHRYLNLLEISFLTFRVPAYAVDRTKRLIKSPKLYWGDVRLALHIAGLAEPTGALLENIILQDLLCWRDSRDVRPEIGYWRTTTGKEVDFVIELDGSLLPIEIKATTNPGLGDFASLRAFCAEYGTATRPGLLLHGGSAVEWLAPNVLAAPWWMVC